MNDAAVLLLALALLYLPGCAALVAVRSGGALMLLGAGPLVTIGVLSVSAFLGQLLGVGFEGVFAVLVVLAVAAALWQLARHRPTRPRITTVGLAGTGVALLGVVLAGRAWLRGFGGLATPSQEHDAVTHSLVVAFIARTGQAGPGTVQPADLLSGEPVRYYPAAFHTFAALLTHVSADPVVALNAATVVLVAVAGPLGLFAVAARIERPGSTPAFAGLAALFAGLLFRPAVELSHDAGILAFAAGLALLPGFALCGLNLGRVRDVGALFALTAAALALLTVHPSVLLIAVLSAGALSGCALTTAAGRAWLRSRSAAAGLAGGLALLFSLPWLLAGASLSGAVTSYPEAPGVTPLGDVLGRVAMFAYGPSFDIPLGTFPDRGWDLHQSAFAVLFWIGLAGCLAHGRLRPLAVLWVAWAGLFVLWAAGAATAPVVAQISALFYNSGNRLFNIPWVLAPAIAALGGGALAVSAAGLLRTRVSPLARIPSSPAVALGVVLAAVVYLLGPGDRYAEANELAVSERYGDPGFLRVSPADREAFGYLDSVRADVGRVLNNANDGSTYLYVYTGLPVVNVYPVGLTETQYGIYLLQHFNEIDTSPQVRCLVKRWDITHVFYSRSSPSISNVAAPGGWTGPGRYSYAPGLTDLADVGSIAQVYGNDDAKVYRVDPQVAARADLADCPVSPSVAPRP